MRIVTLSLADLDASLLQAHLSSRVYKAPMPHEEAINIISAGKGCHFEPAVTDAFISLQEEFQETAEHYADHPEFARPAGIEA